MVRCAYALEHFPMHRIAFERFVAVDTAYTPGGSQNMARPVQMCFYRKSEMSVALFQAGLGAMINIFRRQKSTSSRSKAQPFRLT